MIEVFVSGLAFDMFTKAPVVLLKEQSGQRILPIWIGPNEASVIALELSGMSYRRPLTHDLIRSILNAFDAVVQKVVISAIKNDTYYAHFYILAAENALMEIDARPSDSIAMALKMKAPIYVTEDLDGSFLDVGTVSDESLDADDDVINVMDIKNRLRNIKPEDFGNFDL